MADLGTQAHKWTVALVGVFVLALMAAALFPMITGTNGVFRSNGPLDNATESTAGAHTYATLLGAVPTILVIVFIVALILGVIAMLKTGKRR
jgi:hypothetical protein